MPELLDGGPEEGVSGPNFTVLSQKVDLDISFATQTLTGSTSITAQPLTKDLQAFKFNCRQCRILRATIDGKPAKFTYYDPYEKIKIRKGASTVHHHDYLRSKIEASTRDPPEPELSLTLPPKVVIKELEPEAGQYFARQPILQRKESGDVAMAETPTGFNAQEQGPRYGSLKIYIEFEVSRPRDGLHFVGLDEGDTRYPHVFTTNRISPGTICSLFPCLDNANSRSSWEISFRCPKTLGDAFRRPRADRSSAEGADASEPQAAANGVAAKKSSTDDYSISLSEEERSLDLVVVCSGEMVDDNVDPADPTIRNVSFACTNAVAARHIGFAIGPFEYVDLSTEFREAQEDEKLGQSATKVHGFCLPGRADELRNTCRPLPWGIDYFTMNYGSFPFQSYKVCFVEDLVTDFADTAGLSICSNRLLFPENTIDPLDPNTRVLIHALAGQYSGVNIIAREAADFWVVTGIAGFMSDIFMKKLAGNNEYRFRQKLACDKLFQLDVGRYSLQQLGGQLDIDPSELDFLELKSALILFILNNRLTKSSGSSGLPRIINKIFLSARTGDLQNGEVTTEYFQRTCEKLGHTKLDSFFKQWVYGAGCPDFQVTEQFNKKKLVVELRIEQKQITRKERAEVHPSTFLREAKENQTEAWVPPIQPVFTGPMTIRIHEADGTPYEHIVEIKEGKTKFEIPYNTKYKRLKRSKKAKERQIAQHGPEQVGDSHDDVLLYCLGDVLQSEEDVKSWQLSDWDENQERQMGEESYEWIRMDADFEWIGRIHSTSMPIWMYVSQLQQDRDVVAQYQSLQRIYLQPPHPLASTILTRTLMDPRYFHGIRTFAAESLAKQAVKQYRFIGAVHLHKAFSELFCFPDSQMPRANDFTDRATYLVQCAIVKALASVRDENGRVLTGLRKFFIDKIKFNDNSNNEIADCFYVGTLMKGLAESVASYNEAQKVLSFNRDEEDLEEDPEEIQLNNESMNEIERYRRIDEWISSYQSTYTTTAIECIERLSRAQASKDRVVDIFQYTKEGNSDNVRLTAFSALARLGVLQKPRMMKYLLHSLSTDPSPYVRASLHQFLGQSLARLAISDSEPSKPAAITMDVDSGLSLDQEAPNESRQLDIARKSSPEGALAALQGIVAEDENVKSAFWDAILSPAIAIHELVGLLDIAAMLFESSSDRGSLVISLALPHAWRVSHVGKGKLRFSKSSKVRTKPSSHQPLPLDMVKMLKAHELKYTGPTIKEVPVRKETIPDAVPKAKGIQIKTEDVQDQRVNSVKTQMSPPPIPTPIETSLKLNLKRKPSVDLNAVDSPKGSKLQKLHLANTQAPRRSPSVPVQTPKASTPSSTKPTKPSPRPKTRVVKIRTSPSISSKIEAILSLPPRKANISSSNSSSATAKRRRSSQMSEDIPLAQQRRSAAASASADSNTSSHITSPTQQASPSQDQRRLSSQPAGATSLFSSPVAVKSGWNMGGFRNYAGGDDAGSAPLPPAVVSASAAAHTDTTVAAPAALGTEMEKVKVEEPVSQPGLIAVSPAAISRESSAVRTNGNGATGQNGESGTSKAEQVVDKPKPVAPARKLTLKLGAKKST